MKDPTFDFSKMVCFSLYSTANAMIRDYSAPLKKCGISYPQLLVMAALWEKNNVTIRELSILTLFDLGTLTPIIKRLVAADFITALQEPSDKRRKNIRLTHAGQVLRGKAAEVFNNMSCKLSLTSQEQKAVLSICAKINQRL